MQQSLSIGCKSQCLMNLPSPHNACVISSHCWYLRWSFHDLPCRRYLKPVLARATSWNITRSLRQRPQIGVFLGRKKHRFLYQSIYTPSTVPQALKPPVSAKMCSSPHCPHSKLSSSNTLKSTFIGSSYSYTFKPGALIPYPSSLCTCGESWQAFCSGTSRYMFSDGRRKPLQKNIPTVSRTSSLEGES